MQRSDPPAVVLTGGGTGGHLAIVAALRDALARKGVKIFYVGSRRGQDRRWFGEDDTFADRLFLKSRGVVDRRGFGRLAALGAIGVAAWEAGRWMRRRRIGAVVSVGGFSAAPAALAAPILGLPLFIHEQNAVPGRLNRLLRPFGRAYFSSYGPNAVDYPVRASFFELARRRKRVERIIFLGGSQGAKAINDFALLVAPDLLRRGIAVTHQCGERDYRRVREAYAKRGLRVDLFAFDEAIEKRIAQADLAVSRAGASTLWELAANRIPTLFVPYPHAAGDHQFQNASYLAQKGAAWVVRQEALEPRVLEKVLADDLAEVSRRLEGLIAPDGADRIAEAILRAL